VLAACGGCLAASKWNGLFDFFVVWLMVVGVVTQRFWAPALRKTLRPASWGNPFGFSLDIVVAAMLFVGATIYVLSYIPWFLLGEGHNLAGLVQMQHDMYGYHCCAETVMISAGAKHPYASSWWQWPFILKPISYYYHDFRVGAALQQGTACCVAEILALPNPAVWWLGLISVPAMGWLAFRERNKGYLLLFTAYILQWLPWIASPRLAFEYHFFPNLAVICLADAVLLQRVWQLASSEEGRFAWPRISVYVYCGLVVAAFVFWYPIISGMHVTWETWDARMWHWLFGNQWVWGNHSDVAAY
jgi:dolichyl-phosphate-mannose-protein mannosyltransferase